jgi:hypothetical protein
MAGDNIQLGGFNQFLPVFLDHNVTSSISLSLMVARKIA